jgi:hypothetical protein
MYMLPPPGMWHNAIWQVETKVLGITAVSVFKIEKHLLLNIGTHLTKYTTTKCKTKIICYVYIRWNSLFYIYNYRFLIQKHTKQRFC